MLLFAILRSLRRFILLDVDDRVMKSTHRVRDSNLFVKMKVKLTWKSKRKVTSST